MRNRPSRNEANIVRSVRHVKIKSAHELTPYRSFCPNSVLNPSIQPTSERATVQKDAMPRTINWTTYP